MTTHREARGHTLIEALLTVALMGLGLAFGLTLLQGMREHYALQSATERVVFTLATARLLALTTNRAIQLKVDAEGRQYGLGKTDEEPALWQVLPSGVKISPLPRSFPTFYSRGYAAPAGRFTLRNTSGGISIIIAASGRTRFERVP